MALTAAEVVFELLFYYLVPVRTMLTNSSQGQIFYFHRESRSEDTYLYSVDFISLEATRHIHFSPPSLLNLFQLSNPFRTSPAAEEKEEAGIYFPLSQTTSKIRCSLLLNSSDSFQEFRACVVFTLAGGFSFKRLF